MAPVVAYCRAQLSTLAVFPLETTAAELLSTVHAGAGEDTQGLEKMVALYHFPHQDRAIKAFELFEMVCGALGKRTNAFLLILGNLRSAAFTDVGGAPRAYFSMLLDHMAENSHLKHVLHAALSKERRLRLRDVGRDEALVKIARRWQAVLQCVFFFRWRTTARRLANQRRAFIRMCNPMPLGHECSMPMLLWLSWHLDQKRARLQQQHEEALREKETAEKQLGQVTKTLTLKKVHLDWMSEKLVKMRFNAGPMEQSLMTMLAEAKQHEDTAARIGQTIQATCDVAIKALEAIHKELVDLYERGPQDPCRVLLSESDWPVAPPQGPIGSDSWLSGRLEELQQAEDKLKGATDEEVITLWVNFHLKHSYQPGGMDKMLEYRGDEPISPGEQRLMARRSLRKMTNFGTCLSDSECLVRLFTQVAPECARLDALLHIDQESRAQLFMQMVQMSLPFAARLIRPFQIVHGHYPDLMAVFLARLMLERFHVPVVHDWLPASEPGAHRSFIKMQPSPSELMASNESVGGSRPSSPVGRRSTAGATRAVVVGAPLLRLLEQFRQARSCSDPKRCMRADSITSLRGQMTLDPLIAVQRVMYDAKARHNLFNQVNRRIKCFMVHTLLARARGQPRVMTDKQAERELRDYTHFFTEDRRPLPVLRGLVQQMGGTEAELYTQLELISLLVRQKYETLSDIFRTYAQGDMEEGSMRGSGTMSVLEFWSFIRDCAITNASFPSKRVEAVYSTVLSASDEEPDAQGAQPSAHADASAAQDSVGDDNADADSENEDMKRPSQPDLSPRQFLLALILISAERYLDSRSRKQGILMVRQAQITLQTEKRQAGGIVEALNTEGPVMVQGLAGLAVRFYALLHAHVFTKAEKITTSFFREQYRRPEVSKIFHKHRNGLARAFFNYSALPIGRGADDKATERWTASMDYHEFLRMMKDAKLLDSTILTQEQLYKIFANVQSNFATTVEPEEKSRPSSPERHDEPDADDEAEQYNGAELIYPEYLEALAAIASCRYPDPYKALESRLKLFLERDFLPFSRRLPKPNI